MKRQLLLICISICISSSSFAAQQTISLSSGWNAIYLTVNPSSNDQQNKWDNILLNTSGIQTIWRYNPSKAGIEFINNASDLMPNHKTWLVYFTAADKKRLSNLHTARGGQAYLIKTTKNLQLTIHGSSILPAINWTANSYKLIGFHLQSPSTISFKDFLADSPINLAKSYRLVNNSWQKITASDTMTASEAYWLYSNSASNFSGSLQLGISGTDKLDYGRYLLRQTLTIKQLIAKPITISHRHNTDFLYYQKINRQAWSNIDTTKPLNNQQKQQLRQWQLLANQQTIQPEAGKIIIGVKRQQLTSDINRELIISDSIMQLIVPIKIDQHSKEGLWLGVIKLNKVKPANLDTPAQQAAACRQPGILIAADASWHTPAAINMKIIIHHSSDGSYLVQNVAHMFDQASQQYLLVANPDKISHYQASSIVDGRQQVKRLSTIGYGFKTPQLMSGNISTNLQLSLNISPSDSSNPFLHQYHNQHSADKNTKYNLNRHIYIDFNSDNNALDDSFLSAGSTSLRGNYQEVICGLYRKAAIIQGQLALTKISHIDRLIK